MGTISKKTFIILLIGLMIALGGVLIVQKVVRQNMISLTKISDIPGTEWLVSPICTPPCWEGISPGQAATSALALLTQNENATNIQIFEYRETQRGEIRWDWLDNSGGGRIFYNGTSLEKGRIYAIVPSMGCCLALDQIVETYGYPDFVAITKKAIYEPATHLK